MSGAEVEVLSPAPAAAAAWHPALVAFGTSNGHRFQDEPLGTPPPPPRFQPGDEVEAMTTAKGLVGGWYDARIKSHRPSGHYLVVYTSLLDSAAASLKGTVPGSKVRRRYPDQRCSEFAVGERVEVFYKQGWWRATVRKVRAAAEEYVVFLSKHCRNVGCTAEKMRRSLRWVDGAWVAASGLGSEAKSSNGSTSQGQLQSSQLLKNPKEDTQRSADSLGGFPDNSSQGEVEWSTRKKRKSRIPQKSATLKRWINDMKAPAQGDLLTDYQDSMVANKSSAQGHSPFTTEPINQANTLVKRLDRHELRDAMAGIPCSGLLGTSQSQYQHDEAGTRHAVLPSTPMVDDAGDFIARVSSESRKIETALPFEKRSPVWKYIDLEVTPKLGGHPHFWPLEQFPEVEREGIAVALMLTYESLMSNKSRLKMDSSCQTLDEYLKIVFALEEHGFEVQHTRAQLEELRRAKGNHTQLLQKKSVTEALASEVKEKIDGQNAELDLTDNAIMALNQVLGHFNDRRTSLSKRKDENEAVSAKLQKYLWLAEEELMSTERTLQDLLNAV